MWKMLYALENLWQRFDFIWGMIWCQNPSYFGQNSTRLVLFYRIPPCLLSGIPLISAKSLDLRQNLSMWMISYALENLWQRFDFIWGMIWCQNPSYFGQNSTRPVLFYRIPPCFRLIFDQKRTDLMVKNWSDQCYCFYTTWGFVCGTIHGQNWRISSIYQPRKW